MEILASSCDVTGFFHQLESCQRSVLMLDYDGTLAPFKVDRSKAYPYPELVGTLRELTNSPRTRVVIVSGRSACEVGDLLGLDPRPEIWGAHGLERLLPDGRHEKTNVVGRFRKLLSEAEEEIEVQGLGDVSESKLCGTAVHWRGLPPRVAAEVRLTALRAWAPLVGGADLRLQEFDGGLEVRLPTSNKGFAVRQIVGNQMEDCPAAYLGDDLTDEDAFEALLGRALTVLVRPEYRSTAAQLWLRPPEELHNFLKGWLRATGGAL